MTHIAISNFHHLKLYMLRIFLDFWFFCVSILWVCDWMILFSKMKTSDLDFSFRTCSARTKSLMIVVFDNPSLEKSIFEYLQNVSFRPSYASTSLTKFKLFDERWNKLLVRMSFWNNVSQDYNLTHFHLELKWISWSQTWNLMWSYIHIKYLLLIRE